MSRFLNQTFDNRDTTHLKYGGAWFIEGSYNASNVGETGTLASTNDLHATITFTFPIPAIAFYYYGIRRCCGGLYGICIDCDPLNPNFLSIDAVNRTDDGKNPPIVLYTMRFKTPGIHEIIIRNENDTSVNPSGNSQLTINRIDLEVVDTSATTSGSGSSSATTPISPVTSSSSTPSSSFNQSHSGSSSATIISSGSSSVTIPISPVTSSSSTPSSSFNQSQSSHSPPIGAIVGSALGGGFGLVLALFLFWYRLTRRRKMRKASSGNAVPSPFVGPLLQTSPLPLIATTTIPSTNTQYPGRYGYALRPGKGAQPYLPASSTLGLSSVLPSQPSSTPVRREQDAGPLPAGTEEVTLPPEYNEVFSRTISSSNIPSR